MRCAGGWVHHCHGVDRRLGARPRRRRGALELSTQTGLDRVGHARLRLQCAARSGTHAHGGVAGLLDNAMHARTHARTQERFTFGSGAASLDMPRRRLCLVGCEDTVAYRHTSCVQHLDRDWRVRSPPMRPVPALRRSSWHARPRPVLAPPLGGQHLTRLSCACKPRSNSRGCSRGRALRVHAHMRPSLQRQAANAQHERRRPVCVQSWAARCALGRVATQSPFLT